MSASIKLARVGKKGAPSYRIIAIDKRKKPSSRYLENLGTYDPLLEENNIHFKEDRLLYWVKNGAILSEGIQKLIGKKIRALMVVSSPKKEVKPNIEAPVVIKKVEEKPKTSPKKTAAVKKPAKATAKPKKSPSKKAK